jgi:hypothetical protein
MQVFLRWGWRFAAAGFAASLALHLLALARVGFPSPAFAMALHAGVFLLGVPLCFVLMQRVGLEWQMKKVKALYSVCPGWMRDGRYVVGIYFLLNAAIISLRNPAGDLTRAHRYEIPPSVLAFATAGWMLGYYLLAEILYALVNSKPRFCTRGHAARIADEKCPKCGASVKATGAYLNKTSPAGRDTSS